jgi:hypothetical protein
MWYEWESLQSFNTWHNAICQSLGIPDAQTLTYTMPVQIDNKVIAVVHQSEAAGLTLTDLRPIFVEES